MGATGRTRDHFLIGLRHGGSTPPASTMPNEQTVVNAILRWLGQHDGECYKVHGGPHQRRGEPDITGAIHYKGLWMHFNIEVKQPGGKPSRLQIYRLTQWYRCDRVVGVAESVEEVEQIFETFWLQRKNWGWMTFAQSCEVTGLQDKYGIFGDGSAKAQSRG